MKLKQLLEDSHYRYALHSSDTEKAVQGVVTADGQLHVQVTNGEILLKLTSKPLARPNAIMTNDDAKKVAIKLQSILIKNLNWEARLSQSLSYKEPVKQVLAVLNSKVVNPVLIFDGSFKFLAYGKRPDNDWLASIQKGYISFAGQDAARLREKLSNDRNIQGQVITIDGFENRFYIRKVLLRNDDCFFLIVDAQEATALHSDIKQIETVTDQIAAAVGLHNFPYLTQSANLEGVLRDLLSRPTISHTELQNRLQFDPHQLKRPLAVLCIPSKDRRNRIFGTILTKYVTLHYDQYDVYIIENCSPVIIATIKQELAGYLKKHQLTAGISNCFEKLHYLNRYYQQAIKAIKFHHPGESCSMYADHVAADLIAHIKKDNSIQTYLDPGILQLQATDAKLFTTLQSFLEAKENKKVTAARLGIHRSTLDYRLNKIRQDYQLDIGADGKYLYYLLTVLLTQ